MLMLKLRKGERKKDRGMDKRIRFRIKAWEVLIKIKTLTIITMNIM